MENKFNYKDIAEFCKKNYSETCSLILKTADNVLNNVFLFNMPWDMERTEETVDFKNQIDWYYKLNGDPEFLFQLNRHAFLIHLCQAYYLTGEDKYIKKACELFNDWIDRTPLDDGNLSPWRSLEVGMRADNWTQAINLMEDTPYYTEELAEKIKKSLYVHADVLIKTHKSFQMSSNWGVIQDSGLYILGCFLNEEKFRNIALERLAEQEYMQIASDGVHWEQSCEYHNAVLFCYLNVIRFAEKYGYSLSEKFVEKIRLLGETNKKWIRPNHRQPLLGDSDYNDVRDLMSRCAYLFNDGEFKFFGFPQLDYDSAWLFGIDGVKKYENIVPSEPKFLNAYLEDSGNYIIRSDWSQNANYLLFRNGYTGGGHSHADKLHFDMCINGKEVLVDAGRYTYKDGKFRRQIKSAASHNTTLIGKKSFCMPINPWSVTNPAIAIPNPVYENEKCVLLGGGHLGYLDDYGFYCQRQILHIKPNIYVVLDEFRGKKTKKYKQYFHFHPDGELELKNNIATFKRENTSVDFFFLNNGSSAIVPSVYSPNYNKLIENKAVELSFKNKGNTFVSTVIAENSDNSVTVKNIQSICNSTQKPFSKNISEGIVIKTKDAEYTVCIGHEEIKEVFLCNDKPATGRLVVYKDNEIIFGRW